MLGMLAAMIALVFIALGASAKQAASQPGGEAILQLLAFPTAYTFVLTFVIRIGSLFAVIYFAAVGGAEWNWGTFKNAVARGESRSRYLLSSYGALGLLAGVGLIVVFLVGIVAAVVGAGLAGVGTDGDRRLGCAARPAEPALARVAGAGRGRRHRLRLRDRGPQPAGRRRRRHRAVLRRGVRRAAAAGRRCAGCPSTPPRPSSRAPPIKAGSAAARGNPLEPGVALVVVLAWLIGRWSWPRSTASGRRSRGDGGGRRARGPTAAGHASRFWSRRRPDGSTRARTGSTRDAARRRRDADVHAGRHERHGQGARSRRPAEVGAQIILANTYHLCAAAGPRAHRPARRPASLHGLGRPILTDSGGFQVVSLGDLRARRRGRRDVPLATSTARSSASRRSTRSRSRRRSGRTSRSAFDQPVPPHASSRAEVADATARTHRWAERCLAAHDRPDQALFGIIQGGLEADLRAESTRTIAALPFDGLCIGGLAGDETPEQRARGARRRRAAARRRPPAALPDGPRVAARPARRRRCAASTCSIRCCPRGSPATARCGSPEGRLNLRNARFLDDPAPGPGGLPLPRSAGTILAGLPGASLPRRRAARLPARDLSQPDLTPRLHGGGSVRRSPPGRSPISSATCLTGRATQDPAPTPASDTQAGAKGG